MDQTPIKSIKHSRILLSPLNWGLGHVSRTVPIIQKILENKNEVIICCDAIQEGFYRNYFPSLWYVRHQGYPFRFKGNGNWSLDILSRLSSLHLFLQEERKKVDALVEKFNPDLIISDQRFGFLSKKVKSIIISHQLNLPVSNWNILAKLWNKKLLNAFDEIWIPDNNQHEFSGDLSKGRSNKNYFIGTSSRFYDFPIPNLTSKEKEYHYLGIISGPAPYNQQLLDLFIKKINQSEQKSAIIVPTELYDERLNTPLISVFTQLNHIEFTKLLLNSEVVVSRSGYSTIMDLFETKNKAILIPTPGQSEQIYLSKLHKENKNWNFKTEDEFLAMEL